MPESKNKFDSDLVKIVEIAKKQYDNADDYRQPRLQEIRKLEDILDFITQPTLRGKINIPFDSVLATGFIDTLVSQVNQPPRLEFVDRKGQNSKAAAKTTAAWEFDSSSKRGRWKQKDRWSKRLCAISNIGILTSYSESDPEYKSYLKVEDHLDFLCEPNGGGSLEDHSYYGLTNTFTTADQLEAGVKSLGYINSAVSKLKTFYTEEKRKELRDKHRNKIQRMAARGLDIERNNYVGQDVYNLTRWFMTYKGERIFVLFDYESETIVKIDTVENIFQDSTWPTVVWKATEDPFDLWGRGPFDRIAPVFEAIRLNLNEILNNVRKRNWDMKIVDGKMFPDISELDYRQDGVAIANVPAGQRLEDGIYYVKTPDVSIALNFTEYLNDLAGINSGISDQTKGASSQDILGIARIDEMNLSRRIRLVGDSYQDAYEQVGHRWKTGIYNNLPEKFMVKIAGAEGSEWEELTKEDLEPEYDVSVIVSDDEKARMEESSKRKAEALERISRDPVLSSVANPVWRLEQELEIAGWSPDDIERAKDVQNSVSNEEVEEARRGIERILEGDKPDIYRNASMSFLNYIDKYMRTRSDLKPDQVRAIQKYWDDHVLIAQENEARKQSETQTPVTPEEEARIMNEIPTAPEINQI